MNWMERNLEARDKALRGALWCLAMVGHVVSQAVTMIELVKLAVPPEAA